MTLIFCECGCGTLIEDFFKNQPSRKKRRFVSGHQSRGKNNSMHGKHLSEEHKEKLRESNSGEKNGMFGKVGKLHPCFGKVGEDASNWQGGKTSLNVQIRTSDKYSDWRTQIFGRDNFTCQECGVRGSWLEVHHKKQFHIVLKENNITTFETAMNSDELWDLNNGITLCKQCHVIKPKGNYKEDYDT